MKNKNKLKYLTLGMLLTGAVGFSTLTVKQVQVKAENENVVNINRENKKLVSYDENNYTITLSAEELNNYQWNNLYDYIWNYNEDENLMAEIFYKWAYNNEDLILDEYTFVAQENYSYCVYAGADYVVDFNVNNSKQFSCFDNDDVPFENDLILYCTGEYLEVKSAIELDIQANESSYGESIITAISSGLGLIPDLAQEFLSGFTTLFWDSVNEKLTDFGTFALVFLGVAITMAVVKLCLAILRSNTGA